jgi:hypothetical protein
MAVVRSARILNNLNAYILGITMNKTTIDNTDTEYELVPFHPTDNPEQEGCMLLRPVVATPKRWRSEVNGIYYFVSGYASAEKHYEARDEIDCKLYVSGNYFKEEATTQAVANAIKLVFDYVHTDDSDARRLEVYDKLEVAIEEARQKVQKDQ